MLGKHLHVSSMNQSFVDCTCGHDGYAQCEIILSSGNLVQLKRCRISDYLGIQPN